MHTHVYTLKIYIYTCIYICLPVYGYAYLLSDNNTKFIENIYNYCLVTILLFCGMSKRLHIYDELNDPSPMWISSSI